MNSAVEFFEMIQYQRSVISDILPFLKAECFWLDVGVASVRARGRTIDSRELLQSEGNRKKHLAHERCCTASLLSDLTFRYPGRTGNSGNGA